MNNIKNRHRNNIKILILSIISALVAIPVVLYGLTCFSFHFVTYMYNKGVFDYFKSWSLEDIMGVLIIVALCLFLFTVNMVYEIIRFIFTKFIKKGCRATEEDI